MKKLITLLLILTMVCGVVACGTPAENSNPDEGTNVTTGDAAQALDEESKDNEHVKKDEELKEGGMSVNPEYLDLFGMNKGQVDAMYGEGKFWTEWALMVYDNGVQVSYGTYNLDGDLDDSDMVYRLYLPLKHLFNDCPTTVTEEDIKNTFVNVEDGYSDEEGTKTLLVTYKGKQLIFYPEWGMDPETSVYIAD